MGTTEKARFARRLMETGRYESICLRCFRTIGAASGEPGLEAMEGQHVCADEDMIALYGRMGPEPVSSARQKKERA